MRSWNERATDMVELRILLLLFKSSKSDDINTITTLMVMKMMMMRMPLIAVGVCTLVHICTNAVVTSLSVRAKVTIQTMGIRTATVMLPTPTMMTMLPQFPLLLLLLLLLVVRAVGTTSPTARLVDVDGNCYVTIRTHLRSSDLIKTQCRAWVSTAMTTTSPAGIIATTSMAASRAVVEWVSEAAVALVELELEPVQVEVLSVIIFLASALTATAIGTTCVCGLGRATGRATFIRGTKANRHIDQSR